MKKPVMEEPFCRPAPDTAFADFTLDELTYFHGRGEIIFQATLKLINDKFNGKSFEQLVAEEHQYWIVEAICRSLLAANVEFMHSNTMRPKPRFTNRHLQQAIRDISSDVEKKIFPFDFDQDPAPAAATALKPR